MGDEAELGHEQNAALATPPAFHPRSLVTIGHPYRADLKPIAGPRSRHANEGKHLTPGARPSPDQGRRGPAESLGAAAIESLLPSLRHRLLRHARFAVYDDGLAEDLVQETLIAVMAQHGQRRGEATLLTWATAILKNKVADWYRSAERRRIIYLDTDDASADAAIEALYTASGSYADPVPAWEPPEDHLERRQMMTVLERCVSCLPRQAGRVFMMREWLGFETSEICQRLGVTSENCRTILHRARMTLRACMQRDWIGREADA